MGLHSKLLTVQIYFSAQDYSETCLQRYCWHLIFNFCDRHVSSRALLVAVNNRRQTRLWVSQTIHEFELTIRGKLRDSTITLWKPTNTTPKWNTAVGLISLHCVTVNFTHSSFQRWFFSATVCLFVSIISILSSNDI